MFVFQETTAEVINVDEATPEMTGPGFVVNVAEELAFWTAAPAASIDSVRK